MLKILLFVVVIIAFILLMGLAIMILWAWVVPDVFAGAVERGILPGTLTFLQALKLAILLMVLGVSGHSSNRSK